MGMPTWKISGTIEVFMMRTDWKTGLRNVRRECAMHKDTKYEGKADLEEMACLLEGNTRTPYEIYKGTVQGFERQCARGAFGSMRDSRKSTRHEFVLNTSQNS